MRLIVQTMVAIDQLLNALLFGYADETLSSRVYRGERDGKFFGRVFRPVIDTLFFWQTRHCQLAYLAEVYRRQYPTDFR